MKRAWAFALALLSALSLHAQAQTQTLAQAQTQTLAQALDEAWARAPQAGAFAARETEAKAGAELAANLLAAPASVSLSTLNDRLGSGEGLQEWEVELTLPLWLPGHAIGGPTIREPIDRRRAPLRGELAVAVVLHHEEHGQLPGRGEVQRLVEHALVGRAVPEEGDRDAIAPPLRERERTTGLPESPGHRPAEPVAWVSNVLPATDVT